jgi:hypothetical protein
MIIKLDYKNEAALAFVGIVTNKPQGLYSIQALRYLSVTTPTAV